MGRISASPAFGILPPTEEEQLSGLLHIERGPIMHRCRVKVELHIIQWIGTKVEVPGANVKHVGHIEM
jgi:hypothetical protein